jgi:hypothetical protein
MNEQHATDTHPLQTSIGDFIAGLKELERDYITKPRIAEYMAAMPLRAEVAGQLLHAQPYLSRRTLRGDDHLLVAGAEDGDPHPQRTAWLDDRGAGRGRDA